MQSLHSSYHTLILVAVDFSQSFIVTSQSNMYSTRQYINSYYKYKKVCLSYLKIVYY